MPRDDEQRIVDADTQHHQLGQLRGDVRDVHGVGQDADQPEPGAERGHGAGQRQGRRAHGTEDDQQDDQRGDEAERERRHTAVALADVLERVAGELDLQGVAAQRLEIS